MPEPTSASIVQAIPIDQILPSRHQARKDFDEESIKSLAESMAKEGLIQPITVRQVQSSGGRGPSHDSEPGNRYWELIAGERRLRAAKFLGWPAINALVIEVVSEAAASAKGLVENLQRMNLNPMEEAEGFARQAELDPSHWTHDEIAKVAGHSRVYVTQSLGLLKLTPVVQDYVRRLTLNRSQALEIMRLSTPEEQRHAAEKAKDLSWKETRKLVDDLLGVIKAKKSSKTPLAAPDPLADLWTDLHQNNGITGFWEAKYGIHNPSPGQSLKGWFFFAMPMGENPKEDMTCWFEQMAIAMRGGDPMGQTLPEAAKNVQAIEQSLIRSLNPQLPKSDDEVKELEAVATKGGPKAVYARIYGEGSPMTQMAPESWEEVGMTATEGLRQILEGIRKMQG